VEGLGWRVEGGGGRFKVDLRGQRRAAPRPRVAAPTRKVDVRLPGKGNSNSHGARPVHLIITMIKWIPTSRLPIKNSLSAAPAFRVRGWELAFRVSGLGFRVHGSGFRVWEL